MANDTPVPLNRIERILRNMFAAVAGISILGIVVVLVASLAGMSTDGGVWPAIRMVPFIGLPLAFVLMVVFLIVSLPRRRRLERDGG